ncbi:MSHA biogenesis protein MshD [Vibrio ostreicida]|uniref:MSHA biogenesis protein MshD n=2 Tax=Vibrio ostreicida TaxID=526588 RepID=A0ABT8BQA1_9VIBR|nr:MSHA biogenesis protein MshD [Vibrio ostreicida]MDN3608288.1 MSHA biogenesis protein MshD [Vibrio ostreicida]NPD09728.1 MSHA biogenesis protein MshD [Vibrio ostreicida]
MVVVIVIIAIAMGGVSIALFPKGKQSAEQVSYVKAAELGRAVMDEVLGRNFDQNSGVNGGVPECVITTTVDRVLCTLAINLGPDSGESDRTLYNDVDDFNGINGPVSDVLGADISSEYQDFTVAIQVFYEEETSNDMSGIASSSLTHFKRINVTITDRQGNDYSFAATKGNF